MSNRTRKDAIAIEFLEKLRLGGPWVLTGIDTVKGAITTVTAKTADEVQVFVSKHEGARNLYYAVNPLRQAVSKKAAKTDVAAIEYFLADLDPNKGESSANAKTRYLAQLERFEPRPTAAIDSGNGIQCLWRLQERISLGEPTLIDGKRKFSPEDEATIADAEARVEAVMVRLGSKAGTQNIDRILRLPGTTNLPTKAKLEAGRVPCPTALLWFNGEKYPLTAFPPGEPPKPKLSAGDDIDALPLTARIKNLIRGIDDPAHPYPSRSERVLAVLVAMAGAGCSDEQMAGVMHNDKLPIGQHVRDQSNPERCLERQIAQARKLTTDPNVAKLNETYALVIVGDKAAVMKTSAEGVQLWTTATFSTWFDNRWVQVGEKKVPLGKYWLHHAQRRQYEGLVFAPNSTVPGHYNLWHGWALEPKPGDCSKFLAHIKDNVCCGDPELFKWVVGWWAQIFQHPEEKMETSLVLRGEMGTGKTKVGKVMGGLIGDYYRLVSEPRYVTGRFNSHMAQLILLHADEAFWAGDRSAEGKLKDMVTGTQHGIEFKGKETIWVTNYMRLFITGNAEWQVPAGYRERRFAVLDVSESHMQDLPYFAAIDAEMDSGGREALLHHLLNYDLSTVNLRAIPKTAALLDQKIASLSITENWWLDVLQRGELPSFVKEETGELRCSSAELHEQYIKRSNQVGRGRKSTSTELGMFLAKTVGSGLHKGRHTYTFPPLAVCRERFAKKIQSPIAWNDPGAEWEDEGL